LICNGSPETNELKFFDKLSINTFVFEKANFDYMPNNYWDGYSINNLVFKNSYLGSEENVRPLTGLNVTNLKVLTFINSELQDFDWNTFKIESKQCF